MADLLEKARAAGKHGASDDTAPWGYTAADIDSMRVILRELAKLEDWPDTELAVKLDQLARMAPCNVPAALVALTKARKAWMASWPNAPQKRPEIVLCRLTVINGGKDGDL